jgi:hypothetical protein
MNKTGYKYEPKRLLISLIFFILFSCHNVSGGKPALTVLYAEEAVDFITNFYASGEHVRIIDELAITFHELAGITLFKNAPKSNYDKRTDIYKKPDKIVRIVLVPYMQSSQVVWLTDLIKIDDNTILICKIELRVGGARFEKITENDASVIQARKDLVEGKVIPHNKIKWKEIPHDDNSE